MLFFVALGLSIWFDGFERIAAVLDSNKAWYADEVVAAMLLSPLSITFVAVRILGEAQRELQLRQAAEAKMNRMALHDPLTGLPNRRNAEQAIADALRTAADKPFAALLIDLNRYRAVNDLHGHVTGDLLLLEVGARLQDATENDAFVGHLGGDEFLVLLHGVSDGDQLIANVQTISQTFDDAFQLGDVSIVAGASIGVAVARDCASDARTLLTHADAAMHRCKKRGANGFAFFEPGMEFAAKHRAEIEAELRSAIEEGRIVPFYQPLVDLQSGGILGYEVLARWRLEDGGLCMPDEFIPIAEETDQIGNLFYALLRRAMQEVSSWSPQFRYSLNLSAIQFTDEWLVERILQILVETGMAPGRLELEITESAIDDDVENVRKLIAQLKAQRISVALDDFGTGYSSLRHLSELEFDTLKIDKSFVMDLDSNAASQNIVRSVAALAHSLGLRVSVEGVENQASADIVRQYGCDIGQGYLFGHPAETECVIIPRSEKLLRSAGGG
ncbi:MAG: EAL domain-containing protein [Novosphingobium sp.]|nr:EAL domain-containing protein [Novosphingobium sp.]